MRLLPWHVSDENSSYFFLIQELWRMEREIECGSTREIKINEDGVYVNNEKLSCVKNKYNIVYKNLKKLDREIWKLRVDSFRNNVMRINVYIDLQQVSNAIKNGLRFHGREILFSRVQFTNQEIRTENHILEMCRKGSVVKNLISEAFDKESNIRVFYTVEFVSGLKTDLYEFQKRSLSKMIELEYGVSFNEISKKYTCFLGKNAKVWLSKDDILNNTEECETFRVEFKGGFLTDNMGMGKTLTLLALCLKRPIMHCEVKMRPKATLVICPSHIISHWSKEIEKHTELTFVIISVKEQMQNINIGNVMNGVYDFVIVSFNLFCNPFFRSQMDYYSCNVVKKGDAFLRDFKRQSKEEQDKQCFIPFIFDWGRIIVDEFHELSNKCYPNLASYVASLKSDVTWFVSGTPTVNISLCQNLIPCKMLNEDVYENVPSNDVLIKIINASNVKNTSYEEIKILPMAETVKKIELSKSERIIYNGIKHEGRDEQLKVCSCVRLAKCVISETEVETIQEMKDNMKKFLHKKLANLESQLEFQELYIERLRRISPEVHSREHYHLNQFLISKEKCEKNIDDTKKTIEYVIKSEQDECVICLEKMENPCMIKLCGHQMCSNCLPLAQRSNSNCPMCRVCYTISDIIKVNKECDDKMLRKYGSKLYNLFKLLHQTPNVKTLIFSQWDELLKDIGKCISMYDETKRVLFCKGSISQKEYTINKFKNDENYNLLLLSTINSGSGCDLSIAKRVILLDTLDGSGQFITGIEHQATARCHRIGQKNQVEVVRFIAKDTIEEELYDELHKMKNTISNRD
jgi:SNF2 family DNA or RNA helicase